MNRSWPKGKMYDHWLRDQLAEIASEWWVGWKCVCSCWVAQPCLTFCKPMDCSLPGPSVRGIFQAKVLGWVAISSSRGSSQPRDQTRVSCMGRRILYHWATREAWGGGGRVLYFYIQKKSCSSSVMDMRLWISPDRDLASSSSLHDNSRLHMMAPSIESPWLADREHLQPEKN